MAYPIDVIRCPVHGTPDCSPMVNGCTIPSALAQAYDAGGRDAKDDPFTHTLVVETREELTALLADDTHIVNLRPDGYGLRHGFPCRATGLLGCPVDKALAGLSEPPSQRGYHFVEVHDGELRIGNPTVQEYDPTVDRLNRLIERLTDA